MSEPSQPTSLKLSSLSSKSSNENKLMTQGFIPPPLITPPKKEKKEYKPPKLNKTTNELI